MVKTIIKTIDNFIAHGLNRRQCKIEKNKAILMV